MVENNYGFIIINVAVTVLSGFVTNSLGQSVSQINV
jgi:hypothetical protein